MAGALSRTMSAASARVPGAVPLCHPRGVRAMLRSSRDAAERLHRHWLDLAAEAAEPNPFLEPWFAGPALRHLDKSREIRMLEVWSDAAGAPALIGLLPLRIGRSYGRLPVPHVTNWRHAHSFYGAPLIRSGSERDFWRAALILLDRERWARAFLHLSSLSEGGPVHRGLIEAASELGRPCDVVHRFERALLQSRLSPAAYYESTVRKKKRKELKRLASRLAELGKVETRLLEREDELGRWCDAFLALEQSGWKGGAGSALGCSEATEAFFRESVRGAFAAGKLDFLSLDLDGSPIAMLVNFLTPPGSFSFKIAFDEGHARFSPGVLIQLDNLRILDRGEIDWMDSCAAEDHPMINSLWGERRAIVRVTVPLAGPARNATFRLCRMVEDASAALRQRATVTKQESQDDDD